MYLLDCRGRDTTVVSKVDMTSGQTTLVTKSDRGDIIGAMIDPLMRNVQAVWSNYTRIQWKFLDPAVADDFSYLQTVRRDGDIVVNQSIV